MLHGPGREGQEKTGEEIAKFSAVWEGIRGEWKTVGLEAPHADPKNTIFLSSSHIIPNRLPGLQVYHS